MSDKKFDYNNPEERKQVDDIWNGGFEAGVAYTFGHLPQDKLNPSELYRFVSWIELKCPWLSFEEWYRLIAGNYVNLTKESYDDIKRTYSELREERKDYPWWIDHYDRQEQELDDRWKRIQETGTYRVDIPKVAYEESNNV